MCMHIYFTNLYYWTTRDN